MELFWDFSKIYFSLASVASFGDHIQEITTKLYNKATKFYIHFRCHWRCTSNMTSYLSKINKEALKKDRKQQKFTWESWCLRSSERPRELIVIYQPFPYFLRLDLMNITIPATSSWNTILSIGVLYIIELKMTSSRKYPLLRCKKLVICDQYPVPVGPFK